MPLPATFRVHVYLEGFRSPMLLRGKANEKDAWIETRPAGDEAQRWLRVPCTDLTPLLAGLPADYEYLKTLNGSALIVGS